MNTKQNKNIDYWERALKNPPKSYIKLFEQEQEYLKNNIKKNQKVIDIGCGDGRNILSIVDITINITGIDIDPKAVKDTKKNLTEYPDIRIILGDVTRLPFNDKIFDTVIFSMTLVNLNNQKEKALSEMKRILKDNGQMIISVYSEKAIKERRRMYEQVKVPIKSELNGKFTFDIDNFTSEQFSINEIKKIIKPIGLKIVNIKKVENLAYIFTLKMI